MLERIGILRGAAGAILFLAVATGLTLEFAIDTQDHVTVDEARALQRGKDGILGTADDVKHAIVGLTYWSPCGQPVKVNPNAEDSLRSFQAVGIETYGYALVDSHLSGTASQEKARSAVKDQAVWNEVNWVAPDFEIPSECYVGGTRVPYQTIVDAGNYWRAEGKCVQWHDGCRSVLYTSCGEWTSRLPPGNLPKPPMTVLWNASWDNDPDIDYERCPFAGYSIDEVLVEQWSGGTVIAGVHLDQNTMVVVPTPTATSVPPITPPSCECPTADWGGGVSAEWNGAAWTASDGRTLVPLDSLGLWLWFDAEGHLAHVEAR